MKIGETTLHNPLPDTCNNVHKNKFNTNYSVADIKYLKVASNKTLVISVTVNWMQLSITLTTISQNVKLSHRPAAILGTTEKFYL